MMRFDPPITCPLSFAPPFMPPWRRELPAHARRRLMAWCEELLPGAAADVVEWVGADPRQPIHAIVVSFPRSRRPPVVLYRKVDDVERHHLARALRVNESANRILRPG